MTVQAFVLMTTAQKIAATALDDENQMLGAREIDNALANNLGLGTLVGKWVAPARLLNDPDYSRWIEEIGALPISILDSDVLFLPFVID